jgi:uncharacterized membrane protein
VKARSHVLASAAAALFVAGVAGQALAADDKASEATIKCEGVNQCKGQSACKGAHNNCSGQNSCKGKGFEMLTPDACTAAKAAMKKK